MVKLKSFRINLSSLVIFFLFSVFPFLKAESKTLEEYEKIFQSENIEEINKALVEVAHGNYPKIEAQLPKIFWSYLLKLSNHSNSTLREKAVEAIGMQKKWPLEVWSFMMDQLYKKHLTTIVAVMDGIKSQEEWPNFFWLDLLYILRGQDKDMQHIALSLLKERKDFDLFVWYRNKNFSSVEAKSQPKIREWSKSLEPEIWDIIESIIKEKGAWTIRVRAVEAIEMQKWPEEIRKIIPQLLDAPINDKAVSWAIIRALPKQSDWEWTNEMQEKMVKLLQDSNPYYRKSILEALATQKKLPAHLRAKMYSEVFTLFCASAFRGLGRKLSITTRF